MRKVRLDSFEVLSASLGMSDAPKVRACDHPHCSAPGEHRAPKSRDQLTDYYWFCPEHAAQYNRAWNYYAGLAPDEIEREIQFDTMWNRPTWPLGSRGDRAGVFGDIGHEFADPYELFQDVRQTRRESHRNGYNGVPGEATALQVLQLDETADMKAVKTRYKELVKKYHPDANGGDKAAEEELKRINEAYSTLKKRDTETR